MNLKKKREVIKHITLGTNEVLYYPYTEGKQPLPLRPISSWEMDDCFYRALEETPDNIANFIVKVKLDLIDRKTNINVENTGYVKLMKFYNTIDYWVVYYGMKDFQDESFSIPNFIDNDLPQGFLDIRKMDEVHEIAKFILTASNSNELIIKEVFRNEFGKELGYLLLFLKQPLADVQNITNLQRDFMIYAHGDLPKIIQGDSLKDKYMVSGKKMTVKEILERFN